MTADLGFSVVTRERSGEVEVRRAGRVVTVLRPPASTRLIAPLPQLNEAQVQQRLARVTGNYKRGNERSAKSHARNGG
jgi:hypothetical protein